MNQPSENPASLLFGESAGLQTEEQPSGQRSPLPPHVPRSAEFRANRLQNKGAPISLPAPAGNPASRRRQELQRPLTRYAVDFVITIQESQLREDPGGFT